MQQRNEKVAEPSMEDILASIRKIISEEPSPTKTAPAAPIPRAAAPSVASPAAPAAPPRPAVAEAPRPIIQPAPAPAAPAQSRLSDFVRELAPTAVPVGAPSTASFQDDLDDLVESEVPTAAPEPAQQKPVTVAAAMPVAPPPAKVAPSPEQVAAPAQRPADLGAFIPSSAQSIGMSSPRPQALSIGPDLRAFDVPKPVSREFPAAQPAPSRPIELGIPVPLADNKPAAQVAAPAAEPVAADEADQHDAAQKALGALAMSLATPSLATAPTTAPASAIVPAAPSAIYGESPAEPAVRKSLDDTIVGMLRPMIGDWLDEHLPEMVEKALRQELSERGKSGS